MAWQVGHDLSREERRRVHRWIAEESYWARGIPEAVFARAIEHSLCFVLRDASGALQGFARVVTDRATFAYLCDVFVDAAVRGRGGGRALVGAAMAHPDLQGLRRFLLGTRDAHGLYAEFGFEPVAHPERLMQRLASNPYGVPVDLTR